MSASHPTDGVVSPSGSTHPTGGDVIPLREATKAWFAISLQTFGGPAGQIAIMQHKLVDEKRWIGQQRFLHALNYCTLLPGPEAQQLAIYTGWLLNGTRGGLIAGSLFVLPRSRPPRPVRDLRQVRGDRGRHRSLRGPGASRDRDRDPRNAPRRQE